MQEQESNEFFYRKFGTAEFVKHNAKKRILIVQPKDFYHEETAFWSKGKWEPVSLFTDEGVVKKDGTKIGGIVAEYLDKKDVSRKTFLDCANFSYALKILSNPDSDSNSNERKLAEFACDFTEQNFTAKLETDEMFALRTYYEAKTTDKDEIWRGTFGFTFHTDFEKLTLEVSLLWLDYDSPKKYSKLKFFFDMKNGIIKSPSGYGKNRRKKISEKEKIERMGVAFWSDSNEYFPKNISLHIIEILENLARKFTGKNLLFKNQNESKDTFSEAVCGLVFVPYYPELFNSIYDTNIFRKKMEKFPVERQDGDIFNKFLAATEIPNIKSIRKTFFDGKTGILTAAYRMKKAGFADLNSYNLAATNHYFIDALGDSYGRNAKDADDELEKNLSFYLKYALTKKTEISALKTLLKINDENEMFFKDGLNMFRLYFEKIPEILKRKILRFGFNEENHNQLSLLAEGIKKRKFKYNKNQLSFQDKIEDYEFALPEDSRQLVEIGIELHNCVASYVDNVLKKRCTIVYAKKNGKYALCIEVRKNKVHQERADSNKDPDEEQNAILKIWREKHKLLFTKNKY